MGLDVTLYLFEDLSATKIVEYLNRQNEIWLKASRKKKNAQHWPTEEERIEIVLQEKEVALNLKIPYIEDIDRKLIPVGFIADKDKAILVKDSYDEGFNGITHYLNQSVKFLFDISFENLFYITQSNEWKKPYWDFVFKQIMQMIKLLKNDKLVYEQKLVDNISVMEYEEFIEHLDRISFSLKCIMEHSFRDNFFINWSQ